MCHKGSAAVRGHHIAPFGEQHTGVVHPAAVHDVVYEAAFEAV